MYNLYTLSHLFTVYRFYSGEAILRPQAKLYSGRYRAKQHTTSKIIFSLCVCMCESEAVSSVYTLQSRGRIFGRNPDKSLKSFPPFYSQSTHTVSATSCFTEGHTPPYLLLKLTDVLTDVITDVLTDV